MNKFSATIFLPLCFLVLFCMSAQVIFAQDSVIGGRQRQADVVRGSQGTSEVVAGEQRNSPGSVQLNNPLNEDISSIPLFFKAILDILLIFAIPFIVFFIIYAGFLYVSARGNAETIKKAHAALLYALIGGMLILGANVLLDIITNTVTQIK